MLNSISSKLDDVTLKVINLERKPTEWYEYLIKYAITCLIGLALGRIL